MTKETVVFTLKKLERFEKRYKKAVADGEETFEFEGHEYVTAYAKYLIAFLSGQLQLKGGEGRGSLLPPFPRKGFPIMSGMFGPFQDGMDTVEYVVVPVTGGYSVQSNVTRTAHNGKRIVFRNHVAGTFDTEAKAFNFIRARFGS